MSGYIGTQPVPQATQTRDVFTATSGQTSFATSGYTPNFLDCWLNGVKLINGDDFTATNGSDVVLTTGATAGDTVEVLSYSTFEVNSQTFTGTTTLTGDLQATTATFSGAVTGTSATLSGGVYLGGTGAANLLDDYEEGTFTPQLQFGGATTGISYAAQFGRYIKIGTLVYINIAIHINSKGTATGAATIAGLPFTQSAVGTNFPNLSLRSVTGITFTNCLYATANDGATTITLMDDNGSGTQTLLTNADFLNATEFNITGVYEAA